MTARSLVSLALTLAMIVTACANESPTVTGEPANPSIAVSTPPQPSQSAAPSPTPDEAAPVAAPPGSSGVIFDGSAGADEAAGAVRGLLASINAGDVLGALAHIDPAERDLIAELYLTAVDESAVAWPQFAGDDAIAALKVEVLALSSLRATQYNDDLAWVETDEVEFYMEAPTEVAAAFFADQEPWGRGSNYRRDEIAHREDDWSGLTYLFGSSSDVLPGLMVTKLDDRWYVSFGRTMLELLRVDAEYRTDFPAQREMVATKPSDTPEAAVIEFLAAIADDRMEDAAAHLVAAEGQAFADYPAMLDHWLPGLLNIDIALESNAVRVVEKVNGRAVVEAAELTLTVAGIDHDEGVFDDRDVEFEHELALADRCLTVNAEAIWCESIENYATMFTSFYSDLGWEGLRLVTVQSDDGWSVSLYESLAHYGLPIVSDPLYGLGYSQMSLAIFNGPIGYTVINETAKTLPLQISNTITLEPHARNRLLIARIEASEEGDRVLHFDPSTLDRECAVTMWNTDMVTNDWGEEPEHYADESCEDLLVRPLQIPAGVELTLTLWSYGEQLEAAVVELR